MRSMWERLKGENGFLQFLPLALGAGKTIYDITKGKDKGPDIPAPPDYFEDPDYSKTQDYLRELGIDILGGDIPDYFRSRGEAGGPEFENYLNMMTGDINRSALETAAATGGGGGAATEIASRNAGQFSTQARYADFLRSLEGKQWLFGKGKDITEGVRTAGQVEGGNRNIFNLKQYGLNVDKVLNDYGINRQLESEYGGLIGQDISGAFGAFKGATDAGSTSEKFMNSLEGLLGGYGYGGMEGTKKSGIEPSEETGIGDISIGGTGNEELMRILNEIR